MLITVSKDLNISGDEVRHAQGGFIDVSLLDIEHRPKYLLADFLLLKLVELA